MRTVLGLAKTSTSIGWVLVDGRDVAGDPLDHDAFDVVADASVIEPAATVRRALAIATATGYTVDCVRLTSNDPVHTNAASLRKALRESGLDHVVSVPLTEATRAWARGIGYANGDKKTAVCIVDRDSATLSVIDTRSGAIKATTTKSHDSAHLIDWLSNALDRNGSQPERLYLIGSRSALDAIAGPLDDSLSIPVVATHDGPLCLARGAASSDLKHVDNTVTEVRSGFASHARMLTVTAAVAVVSLLTLFSADSPIRLVERASQQAPPTANPVEAPASAAPLVPLVSPPSPAAAARPTPEEPVPVSIPRPKPVETGTVASNTITAPVQHLPEVQPDLPGSAPLAPGPVASPPAAPIPPQSDAAPPPEVDPLAGVLNPFFSGVP